jgi:Mrp family chromosome partitioning ATPase
MPPRIREAFRTLQIQLQPSSSAEAGGASMGDGGRAIMFTSPSPRDGKTSSAVDFALVLAAADLKVVLLDFDLRKPDIAERLGAHTDYLDFFRSNAGLDEVLAQSRSMPGLRVLSAHTQADATPLLEAVSRRLPELLREARELADYVIVDTPPLGQVSDALRAAAMVDDIVLVARPGNTDRIELTHTRELLDRMGHTPTGLLLIGESGAGDAYANYGYNSALGPSDLPQRERTESPLLVEDDDLKRPPSAREPLAGSGQRRSDKHP